MQFKNVCYSPTGSCWIGAPGAGCFASGFGSMEIDVVVTGEALPNTLSTNFSYLLRRSKILLRRLSATSFCVSSEIFGRQVAARKPFTKRIGPTFFNPFKLNFFFGFSVSSALTASLTLAGAGAAVTGAGVAIGDGAGVASGAGAGSSDFDASAATSRTIE